MRRIALVVLGVAIITGLAGAIALRPALPAAERGRRLAEKTGCFGCHGPGGIRGAGNPGRTDLTVPNFAADVMMYAKSPEEIREWIEDGFTRKQAASATWRAERERGALRMPAFEARLSEHEIDDLVAYVMASSGAPEPTDSPPARAASPAAELGCVGCHGPGGQLARPNPGALKGYVPSWIGPDFPELVRDSTEFREWIEDGVSRRFKADPLASFFLKRAVLRMPAYHRQLVPGDVPVLWAYVTWLRSGAAR